MGADKDYRKDLKFGVLASLFDKLFLGVLLGLFGFQVNALLERNKAETALRAEVKRTRIDSLAKIVGAMGQAEHAIRALSDSLGALEGARRGRRSEEEVARLHADYETALQQARHDVAAFVDVLNRERFWLNDDSFRRIQRHVRALIETLGRPPPIDLERLDRTRPSIADVLDDLSDD